MGCQMGNSLFSKASCLPVDCTNYPVSATTTTHSTHYHRLYMWLKTWPPPYIQLQTWLIQPLLYTWSCRYKRTHNPRWASPCYFPLCFFFRLTSSSDWGLRKERTDGMASQPDYHNIYMCTSETYIFIYINTCTYTVMHRVDTIARFCIRLTFVKRTEHFFSHSSRLTLFSFRVFFTFDFWFPRYKSTCADQR